MIKHSFFIFLNIIFFLNINYARNGSYLSRHYTNVSINNSIKPNSLFQNTDNSIFLINNNQLFYFDGTSWDYILPDCTPTHLYRSKTRLVVICKTSYGTISTDQYGNLKYLKTADFSEEDVDLKNLYFNNNSIYKYSESIIKKYNSLDNNFVKTWKTAPNQKVKSVVECDGETYAIIQNQGIYILQKNGKIESANLSVFAASEIGLVKNTNDGKVIIATKNNNIYLFNGKSAEKIFDNQIEEISQITDIIKLKDNTYAISTKDGRIINISANGEYIKDLLNENIGNSSSPIINLMYDSNGALWYSSYSELSKIELSLPIFDYSVYPGLSGIINNVLYENNNLYVGTSDGLFKLTHQNVVSRQNTDVKHQTKSVTKIVKVTFKSKDDGKPVTKEIPVEIGEDDIVANKNENIISHKGYIYQKVQDFVGSCTHIAIHDTIIYACSTNGLFRISGQKALPVIKNERIDYIYSNDSLLVGASGTKIFLINSETQSILASFPVNLKEVKSINYYNNRFWIGGINSLASVKLLKGNTFAIDNFILPASNEKAVTININERANFILGKETIYSYLEDKDSLYESGNINIICNQSVEYISTQKGYIWSLGCNGWTNLDTLDSDKKRNSYFQLFDDINNIYIDNSNNGWIVSNNKIYKVENTKTEANAYDNFTIKITSVMDGEGNKLDLSKISLNDKNNGILLNIASQWYLKEAKNQYRYKISGLDGKWSSWTNTENILIPYLPNGKYEIEIEAKNIFGNTSSVSVPVKVSLSPFKSWWFYTAIGLIIFFIYSIYVSTLVRKYKSENELLLDKILDLENQK